MSNVADIKAKTVKITLNDGVERTLKYTLNALAELEDKYGSVEAAFELLEKKNSVKALRTILWAGLIHEDENLTEKQVGNLIDTTYMQSLMTNINTAFEGDLGGDSNKPLLKVVAGTNEAEVSSPNA